MKIENKYEKAWACIKELDELRNWNWEAIRKLPESERVFVDRIVKFCFLIKENNDDSQVY